MKVLLMIFALTFIFPVQIASKATVYVYMPHHTATSWRFSGKFYVDDEKTAEISKNRYFILRLKPGSHSFYVRDKKLGGIALDLEPNGIYYLRVNTDEGGYRIRFRGVSLIPKEEAEFIIKRIQPIRVKDIYDPSLVDVSVTTQ